ncbi:unnamed protein product [Cuscuta campestris]|uniref:Pectin acetylesterase n=1 Tax=Cuscuta campestris TaxID=132261 RepID=A0A484KMB3_9ASTE|nr:unnamed protein product [Cuscuta campestris]
MISLLYALVFSLVFSLQQITVTPKLHILESAKAEGAVCLDGSAPAYDWEVAQGEDNKRNWLVYLQGGGWCLNTTIYQTPDKSIQNCSSRATGDLGSSKNMNASVFGRFFSAHSNETYFYKWNRVIVRYCDGGSFAGDADKPDPVTNLYYRGARIFRAVIKDLMTKGLKDSSNVLLAGGSSGGLGVMIHCDQFRRMFSANVRVKCHADSSLFLHVKDPVRARFFDTVFGTVVGMQRPEAALPSRCTSKKSAKTCFFPQNLLRYVESPLFIVNPAFDSFQVANTFSKDLHDRILYHKGVSRREMALLQDFRRQIIGALPRASATNNGYIITSIFGHSLASGIGYKGPMFADPKSKSFESAFLDWYFDRERVHLIDPAEKPFARKNPLV